MKKKMLITLCSVALVLAVTVGATLAYLSAQTDKKENVFTVGAGITGELKEPLWDGDNFTVSNNRVDISGVSDNQLGKNLAVSFVPGRVIPKDPAVENTSAIDVCIAVTLDYSVSGNAATYSEVFGTTGFAEMNGANKTNWDYADDMSMAYYTVKVAPDDKTDTIFDSVKIKDLAKEIDVTDAAGNVIIHKMQGFQIDIKAYLIQAEGYTDADGKLTAEGITALNEVIAASKATTTP